MKKKSKNSADNLSLFDENSSPADQNSSDQIQVRGNDSVLEPEFVRMEKNIAAFGFFTPTSNRSKTAPPKIIQFSQTIDGNRVEAKVTVAGNTLYGMPTTADQDKYLAFQKIIERIKREKGTIQNPVSFTSAELLQLLGHSDGGSNFKEVEEWCDVMASTYIKSEGAMWIAGKKKFASDSFVVFQRVRRAGQELDDGSVADRNYVWLSDWYLENINAHYLLPIDFDTYKQLKNNIAKAMIPLLQIWLYASREQGIFEKRYDELCQILNIAQYPYPSKIKEKLAPSMNELIEQDYLSDWEVSKTADKTGYKITFWHGKKFYSDQIKRMSKSNKAAHVGALRPKRTAKEEKVRSFSPAQAELCAQLQKQFDLSEKKAVELIEKYSPDKIKAQVESFVYRREPVKNTSGFIIKAIENDYSLPEEYLDLLKKDERKNIENARKLAINACQFCDELGYRNIKHEMDPFYGMQHECTHDPGVENQLEEHTF
jgi:hypothetical protein